MDHLCDTFAEISTKVLSLLFTWVVRPFVVVLLLILEGNVAKRLQFPGNVPFLDLGGSYIGEFTLDPYEPLSKMRMCALCRTY